MTKQQTNVYEFMKTFGQDTPASPTSPIGKTRALRVKLLLEEVLELAAASGVTVQNGDGDPLSDTNVFIEANNGPVDLVGVADALADIDYVNQGAAVAYGLNLEPFQDEVHSSNMTKLWKLEEVSGTPALDITRVPATEDGRVCIVRNKDGKILKSPSYRAADLASVMAAQTA